MRSSTTGPTAVVTVNAGNQLNDFIADAADGIDAGNGIDLLISPTT
jgi:hypothetical protein